MRAGTGLSAACIAIAMPIHAQAAVAVLPVDTLGTYAGYKGAGDTVTRVAVTGAPFAEALRVDRRETGDQTYSAALTWQSIADVHNGDLLVATFEVRNAGPSSEPLRVEVTYQLSDTPYTQTLATSTPVDTGVWRRYSVPFIAKGEYPAGRASLQFRYGLVPQTFDIGGVSVVNHGQTGGAIPAAIAGSLAYYYPGRGDPAAPWRTAALANIEASRKGAMTVQVLRADGSPQPGAQLTIAQTRAEFAWGSAVSAAILTCDLSGKGTAAPCAPLALADARTYRQKLVTSFDASSFYNDLKWPEWEGNRQRALDGVAWLTRNGMRMWRGHNLIWPSFSTGYQLPGDLTPATPPAAMKARIAAHFADEVGALKGRVREWDVLNEPVGAYDIQGRIASPGLPAITGVVPTSEVATWYADARKADPAAVLFLNDYGVFENFNPASEQNDLALIRYVQGLGGPIDAMGFQGHFNQSGPVFAEMARAVADFSPYVKAFAVTEFDFTTIDPKLQADLTGDVMTFVFGSPKFTGFQMWGFWDGDHWLGNAPLFDKAWKLKPSGKVWFNLAQQAWRTKATATTDGSGLATLRAFYGRYRITVGSGGKSCSTLREFVAGGGVVTVPAC